jgi:hypothetical protein
VTFGTHNTTANTFILSRFKIMEMGMVSEMNVYSHASDTVKVVMYADNGGKPRALLAANNNTRQSVTFSLDAAPVSDAATAGWH